MLCDVNGGMGVNKVGSFDFWIKYNLTNIIYFMYDLGLKWKTK